MPLTYAWPAQGTKPYDSLLKAVTDKIASWVSKQSANGVVWVEDYGAVGDGATDDTVSIRNAIVAAVSGAQSTGMSYAQVNFGAKTYLVNGSLVQGGTTKGNSLLPLPVVATTAQKVTLEFKGVGKASALPHWQQTVSQKVGTVIKTTKTGLAYDATYGNPSILGGPTAEQIGYGVGAPVFNNMLVIIDGIQLLAPQDPSMHGFDFGCTAEVIIRDAGCQANQTPPTAAAPTSFKSGLVMPYAGNNAMADIISYSVEGWYRGALVGEHTNIYSYRAIYCYTGLGLMYPAPHSGIALYACIEASYGFAVELVGVTAAYGNAECFFDILCLDMEAGASVQDPANHWFGECFYNNNGVGTLTVSGGGNARFVNRTAPVGVASGGNLPALASASPLKTAANRDAMVLVSGGTVSAIALDGQATGLTSGTFFVPSGHTITVTYTVAPTTWKWILV